MIPPEGASHTEAYLRLIGVLEIGPATSPFDPGYDPATIESHLDHKLLDSNPRLGATFRLFTAIRLPPVLRQAHEAGGAEFIHAVVRPQTISESVPAPAAREIETQRGFPA